MRSRRPSIVALACCATLLPPAGTTRAAPLDGINVIVSQGHPFGSISAGRSLRLAKDAGVRSVAIVPFLWQAAPASPAIVRGSDMSDDELRAAIRAVRALGLVSVVKPHVWVDGSWAGAVAMTSKADWDVWFEGYQREIMRIARVAAEERAEVLCFGTEIDKTLKHSRWVDIIAALRTVYRGELTYSAHNIEGAERVPFWSRLDSVAMTLYPPLGKDDDRPLRAQTMQAVAQRLDALAATTGKPVIVSEIGIRSALGAAAKPWESAEERTAPPDTRLQADVLSEWLRVLNRPSVRGVLIWRWFTDPNAGGDSDTDFTIQGKDAQQIVACSFGRRCDP